MEYQILKNKKEREGLLEAAYNISNFIREKGIQTIVALDKSGRPAGLLVSEAYRKLYPNEQQPKLYFLNPTTTKKKIPLQERNLPFLKDINKNPKNPVLILDEYAASGKTVLTVKRTLKELGIENVYAGTLTSSMSRLAQSQFEIVGSGNVGLREALSSASIWSKRGIEGSGVEEEEGRTYISYEKRAEAVELRRELKYLIEKELEKPSLVTRIRRGLEKIVAGVLIVFGLGFLIYQDYSATGNVVSSSPLANSDLGFFVAITSMIFGGAIIYFSLRRN